MIVLSRSRRVFAFDGDSEPALSVRAGASVRLETADCFDGQVQAQDDVLDALDWDRVNPATGPVYVEGARPGDVLSVLVESVDFGHQGVMAVAQGFGVLSEAFPEQLHRIVPIEDGTARIADGVAVPLRPMIGVIGVAPAGAPVSTASPGRHGGNLDTRLITVGTTVYLPVAHEGALFAAGDLHAAMGDGEICGTGVEVSGSIAVRVDVRSDLRIEEPVLETRDLVVTIASAEIARPRSVMLAKTPRPSSGLASRCTRPACSSRRIWRVTRLGSDSNCSARSPIRAEPVPDLSRISNRRTSTRVSLCCSASDRFSVP